MSSTNVHSEENNIQIVCGQAIPTENEMEIPPKSAGRGPSILDVRQGDIMEISVAESELREDGSLVATNGTTVAKFDDNAYKGIVAKYTDKEEKKTTKGLSTKRTTKATDKGEDR